MPSFTLLGSRVMRLPFMLDSAFPHEILHNWWGNGVYVDASHGNWSEGLTAYLADQRIKEQQGEGAEYRRAALQKYATFVGERADFPLASFRSRHDATTQAIGYDKSLMLFHMLRRQLGDEKFFTGLQGVYRNFRFRPATFGDLLAALQAGKAFPLDIPAHLPFTDGKQAEQRETLHMTQAKQTFTLKLPAKPSRLALDPDFDLFRLPDPAELPASLGVLYGKETKTYVLSRKTDAAMQVAWESGLDALKAHDKTLRVQYDDQPLPDTGTGNGRCKIRRWS